LPARNLFTLALFTALLGRPVSERTSLCALNLPPASLLAALKCIPPNIKKTKMLLSLLSSFFFLLSSFFFLVFSLFKSW